MHGLPNPPRGKLSAGARRLWTGILGDYDLDTAALATLLAGCVAFDRMCAAQAQIDEHGSGSSASSDSEPISLIVTPR